MSTTTAPVVVLTDEQAALVIGAHAKGRSERKQREKEASAAVSIQKSTRAHLAPMSTTTPPVVVLTDEQAAVVIGAHAKGRSERKQRRKEASMGDLGDVISDAQPPPAEPEPEPEAAAAPEPRVPPLAIESVSIQVVTSQHSPSTQASLRSHAFLSPTGYPSHAASPATDTLPAIKGSPPDSPEPQAPAADSAEESTVVKPVEPAAKPQKACSCCVIS
jgi:hypothetical protein